MLALCVALVLTVSTAAPAAAPRGSQDENAARLRRGLLPRKTPPPSRAKRLVVAPPAPTWLGEPTRTAPAPQPDPLPAGRGSPEHPRAASASPGGDSRSPARGEGQGEGDAQAIRARVLPTGGVKREETALAHHAPLSPTGGEGQGEGAITVAATFPADPRAHSHVHTRPLPVVSVSGVEVEVRLVPLPR